MSLILAGIFVITIVVALCCYSCFCFEGALPDDWEYYDRSEIIGSTNDGVGGESSDAHGALDGNPGQKRAMERLDFIRERVIEKSVVEKRHHHPPKRLHHPLKRGSKSCRGLGPGTNSRRRLLSFTRNRDADASLTSLTLDLDRSDTPPDSDHGGGIPREISTPASAATPDTFRVDAEFDLGTVNDALDDRPPLASPVTLVDTYPDSTRDITSVDEDVPYVPYAQRTAVADVPYDAYDVRRRTRTEGRKTDIVVDTHPPSALASLSNSVSSLRSLINANINIGINGNNHNNNKKNKELYTTATCFICLEKYKVGEKVYWSPNERCVHSFHKECMSRWLATHDECPLCRENYLSVSGVRGR